MPYFILFLKGLIIGLANVVPGVSGGTMALLLGIYEKLIEQLKALNFKMLKLLIKGNFKTVSQHIDFSFLIFIFIGLGFSVIGISKLLEWLYTNYRVLTLAFFFGLVAASVGSVSKSVSPWTWKNTSFVVVGTLIGAWIVTLNPNTPNPNTIYIFLCGIIAIISMILPGLSGSFILLVMGNYFLILKALNHLDFSILIPFIAGCAVGLISFSHFLSWLLKNYKNQTLSFLIGFIVASLLVLWPWSKTLISSKIIGDKTKDVITGYDYYLPILGQELFLATIVSGIAFLLIIFGEKFIHINDKR